MRNRNILLLSCFLLLFTITGKTQAIDTIIGEIPKFNGIFSQYLQDHIKYPRKERYGEITGTVYATFIVEKDGTVTGVRLLRGVPGGQGLDSEALRVLRIMPKWIAGTKKNGELARVQLNIPIHFNLAEHNEDINVYSIDKVTTPPTYPGGDSAINSYLKENLSDENKKKFSHATISFIIETDGTITNAVILNDSHYIMDPTIVECIDKLVGWTPGRIKKKKKRVKYTLTLNLE